MTGYTSLQSSWFSPHTQRGIGCDSQPNESQPNESNSKHKTETAGPAKRFLTINTHDFDWTRCQLPAGKICLHVYLFWMILVGIYDPSAITESPKVTSLKILYFPFQRLRMIRIFLILLSTCIVFPILCTNIPKDIFRYISSRTSGLARRMAMSACWSVSPPQWSGTKRLIGRIAMEFHTGIYVAPRMNLNRHRLVYIVISTINCSYFAFSIGSRMLTCQPNNGACWCVEFSVSSRMLTCQPNKLGQYADVHVVNNFPEVPWKEFRSTYLVQW